jgi:hypothetical protein
MTGKDYWTYIAWVVPRLCNFPCYFLLFICIKPRRNIGGQCEVVFALLMLEAAKKLGGRGEEGSPAPSIDQTYEGNSHGEK